MSVKFYKDSGLTTRLRQQIGKLEGDDSTTSFVCSEQPYHVRKYSSTYYWGLLLTENTDYTLTDNGDGTWTVTLTTAPATGETVIAISDGEYLFENQYAISNDSSEANRTLEQVVYLNVSGANLKNVVIDVNDYVSGAGTDPTWYQVAPDDGGSSGTYQAPPLNLGDLNDGATVPFWVKVIVPQGTEKNNFHDTYISATVYEFSTNA